jgi:hypothetical protein
MHTNVCQSTQPLEVVVESTNKLGLEISQDVSLSMNGLCLGIFQSPSRAAS